MQYLQFVLQSASNGHIWDLIHPLMQDPSYFLLIMKSVFSTAASATPRRTLLIISLSRTFNVRLAFLAFLNRGVQSILNLLSEYYSLILYSKLILLINNQIVIMNKWFTELFSRYSVQPFLSHIAISLIQYYFRLHQQS